MSVTDALTAIVGGARDQCSAAHARGWQLGHFDDDARLERCGPCVGCTGQHFDRVAKPTLGRFTSEAS
jgi:hypothetical protein